MGWRALNIIVHIMQLVLPHRWLVAVVAIGRCENPCLLNNNPLVLAFLLQATMISVSPTSLSNSVLNSFIIVVVPVTAVPSFNSYLIVGINLRLLIF